MLKISSNIDEELEKMKLLNKLAEECQGIELSKMFVGVDEIAEALHCSKRAAQRFMNAPSFPLIKIGKVPMVNVVALGEYTRQRIVMDSKT